MVWLVEAVWWIAVMFWRPISWLMGCKVLLQLIIALHDWTFWAWLQPVRTFAMGVCFVLFVVHVPHPWEKLSPEERRQRARAQLSGPGQI